MKKKIFKIALIVIGILVVFGAVFAYMIYKSAYSPEELHGQIQDIPSEINPDSLPSKGLYDWPNWRGPQHNGISNFTGIKKDWSQGLKKDWEVNFLCQGNYTSTWSTPSVQGNRLVITGRDEANDLVFCLNPYNGSLIWKGSYPAQANDSHGPGSRATPFIDNDRVYTFGRSGDLACWVLASGKMLWKSNVADHGGEEPTWGHSSSPFVYKDKVIVQGGGKALVCAFDKINGKLVWKTGEGGAGYAATTFYVSDNDTLLLVFHGKALSGVEPDEGKIIWTIPWTTAYDVNATTPAVYEDMIFITSNYDYGCQVLKYKGQSVESLWQSKVIASHHSDPIIIDGYIYGYSGESTRNKGDFKCVELKTGKEMWSTGEVGWGTTILVDGHLICLDIKGNLYLVKPDPQKFIKITELKGVVANVKNFAWTIPVFANGKLYIRYLQQLMCFDLKE